MRAPLAAALTLLSFLPAIHGCGPGQVAEPLAFATALAKIVEVNQVACPELARADVAVLKARPPARPWTVESGATNKQLTDAVDKRDVELERKRLAAERVIAEHERCRGAKAAEQGAPSS